MNYLFSSDEKAQAKNSKYKETGFKSISGLETELDTEAVNVGGENSYTYFLPKTVKYSNLVLSRGIAVKDSFFTNWFWNQQKRDGKIVKKDLLISLLSPLKIPLIIWLVIGAYPISWKVSDFNSTENTLLIEEAKIAYRYFEILKQ